MTALVAALAPLARLCLGRGMGIGEMVVALKLACLGEASRTARLGERANHSQIAAMTGMTRKDIRTLVDLGTAGPYQGNNRVLHPRIERVMTGWKSDPRFHDRRGVPKSLPLYRGDISFDALVRRYGGDVPPIAVLKELQRQGLVSAVIRNRVRLTKKSRGTHGLSNRTFVISAKRLRDHAESLVGGIEASRPTSASGKPRGRQPDARPESS